MARPRKIDGAQITARLIAIKRMVLNMKDTMPRAADQLRRETAEEIDDLIGDIRGVI